MIRIGQISNKKIRLIILNWTDTVFLFPSSPQPPPVDLPLLIHRYNLMRGHSIATLAVLSAREQGIPELVPITLTMQITKPSAPIMKKRKIGDLSQNFFFSFLNISELCVTSFMAESKHL